MLYLGAVTLGALHAFEPGHGKTLIAAYMIGTKGRAIDGMLLGLIVTFTHTFSVILLGIVARLLSTSYSETELHAWLGLFSAILILIVGIWMLKQRLGKDSGHLPSTSSAKAIIMIMMPTRIAMSIMRTATSRMIMPTSTITIMTTTTIIPMTIITPMITCTVPLPGRARFAWANGT